MLQSAIAAQRRHDDPQETEPAITSPSPPTKTSRKGRYPAPSTVTGCVIRELYVRGQCRAPARERPRGAFWSTPMSALSSTLTVRHSPRGNGMSPRSKELANGGWKPRLCRGASRPPRTYLVLQTPQRLAVRSNEGACFCYFAKPQYVPGRMPLPGLGGVCPAVLSPKHLEQPPPWLKDDFGHDGITSAAHYRHFSRRGGCDS